MKKLFLFLFLSTSLLTYAQTNHSIPKEYEGKFQLDNNNNVTYMKIIDVPDLPKDELYLRSQNYFTYNYNSSKAVIESQDKEKGIIIGKGVFPYIYGNIGLFIAYVDAWHILRMDVKDNKVRVILTLTQYECGMGKNASNQTINISDQYPINPKGGNKKGMNKAFQALDQKVQNTFEAIEKALEEGNTTSEIENSDW